MSLHIVERLFLEKMSRLIYIRDMIISYIFEFDKEAASCSLENKNLTKKNVPLFCLGLIG